VISALRPHAEQSRLWNSSARFALIEAGRRSGKTELAIRDSLRCLFAADRVDWRGIFGAPTRDQAKAIYWERLKLTVPPWFVRDVREVDLQINCVNGAHLQVVGLDRPQRIEGIATDKAWIDELSDVKPGTWDRTLRPLLSTDGRKPGRAWLYGVPRPSSQFAELSKMARDPRFAHEWGYYHWSSDTVVDPAEIASARASMDPLTFEQEYGAKRVHFSGRAYYTFERETHAAFELAYSPDAPLELCFDFNNAPGVCVAIQELAPPLKAIERLGNKIAPSVSSIVGEVWIRRGSNSEMVANKALELWGQHRGPVRLWGDPSGGNKVTSGIAGTDWAIIERTLRRVFGARLRLDIASAHPAIRARVNSLTTRLRSADGTIRMLACPVRAPRTIDDLDGVMTLEGTAGELDKDSDPMATHLTDAIGYYTVGRFPVGGGSTIIGYLGS
jgi:hypothetical protein